MGREKIGMGKNWDGKKLGRGKILWKRGFKKRKGFKKIREGVRKKKRYVRKGEKRG